MSKLEELIQKLCPDGVEYKKLGDVLDTCTDYTAAGSFADIAKNVQYLPEPDYALLVRTMDIKSKFTKGKLVFVNKHAYEYLWRVHMDSNCIILPNIGANCGEVYYIQVKDLPDIPCVLGPNAILGRSTECNLKYVFYCLNGHDFQRKLAAIISPGGQTKYNKTNLKMLEIPVPPLPVQEEIVRLLDDFTAKTAELQAELNKEYEARKKQYEYYRDTLLNDEEATRKVTLQDVAQYSKARISSSEVDETNYVGVDNLLQNKKGKVNSNHVPTSGNLTEFQSGDILIGNIRPYLQKIWLSDKTGGTNGDVLDIRPNQKLVTPPFLYQVLASDRFFNYDMQNSKGAKMPRGNKEKVMEYSFALPTLERQREIVLLLNKFEIAFNDLQSNISIELESRQKQYEYYRDKLLTFKELNESEVN